MTLAFAGSAAGLVHMLSGPDHLPAIALDAVDGKAGAWRAGLRWGLASIGVFGVAIMALLLRQALPIERLSVSPSMSAVSGPFRICGSSRGCYDA